RRRVGANRAPRSLASERPRARTSRSSAARASAPDVRAARALARVPRNLADRPSEGRYLRSSQTGSAATTLCVSERLELVSDMSPKGDQPRAIEELVEGLSRGDRHQVLLGMTGSGKTFTTANVIARVNRPTLIIAPNKTLAAQLYGEMK